MRPSAVRAFTGGPMRRPAPRVASLLPDAIRRDVFEPAWLDLRATGADRARRGSSRIGQAAAHLRSAAAVLVLFVDCWCVALAGYTRSGVRLMSMLITHGRHAIRSLARDPVFTF